MVKSSREILRHSPNLPRTHKISNRRNVQDASRGLFFQSCSLELILGNLVPISHQTAVTEEVRIFPFAESDVNSERIVDLGVAWERWSGRNKHNIFH